MHAGTVIFGIQDDDNSCIVKLRTGLSWLFCHILSSFSLFSILRKTNVFVKDVSITVQARMAIFGVQVHGRLHHGIIEQPSPVYSSLYLSDLFTFLGVMQFFETEQPFKVKCLYLIYR